MRQALELTRARWRDLPQQQGISIEIATELVDPCPPVRGVEGELRDALVNLLLNAVDAMPQGGRITLRSRLELTGGGHGAPQLVVEVEDSGIGMDEDTRRRCIEPFFTTKGERGSGLGMAMVFGCLQRHDASLDIDSQPGRGTRVRLQFPVLAPQDGSGAAGLLAQEPAVPRRALDVLLVDDDPLLLEAVGEILSQAGHRVVRASGGRSGVEQFEAALAGRPFDAVITDLGMPEVDGRNVARRVRQLSATTPVIMLTGWGRRMEEDGEMPEGVDLLLSKPPRRRQLLDALDRLAGQR
jgi:CheY-like chemotaxis protein